ncbi:hypothetical protein [Actinomyces vulturis]|uniref:hypothetical protein n=1 Tax=Actinomyces vulturis TaxID=1857645 RepID=UPI000831E098|nr:hypothetical protein [Actinomyces vulturis]
MNRRIISGVCLGIGVIAIILAVLSATAWRPSETAKATMPTTPTTPYVVTEPGVLGMVDADVTVTVTAPASTDPVMIAVGRNTDVDAWLANDPYTAITGLSDWTALTTTEVTDSCSAQALKPADAAATPAASEEPSADASATPAADASTSAEPSAKSTATPGCTPREATNANPAGSDLWLTEKKGTGSITMTLDAADPNLVVLVASDGTKPAPDVALSWPRKVSTPWLIPGLIIGTVFLLIGSFFAALEVQFWRAARARAQRAKERAERMAQADATATTSFAAVGRDPDRPLTRREMRERDRALDNGEEWTDPRTGQVHRPGVDVPEVPLANHDEQAPDELTLLASQRDMAELTHDDADTGEIIMAVGKARGSAVVPALDENTTAEYRAQREIDENAEPFALVDDELLETDDDQLTTEDNN